MPITIEVHWHSATEIMK